MITSTFLAAQAASQGSPLPMILIMVAIFAIMWLFMIRPQQKKQKQIRAFQNSLKEVIRSLRVVESSEQSSELT